MHSEQRRLFVQDMIRCKVKGMEIYAKNTMKKSKTGKYRKNMTKKKKEILD